MHKKKGEEHNLENKLLFTLMGCYVLNVFINNWFYFHKIQNVKAQKHHSVKKTAFKLNKNCYLIYFLEKLMYKTFYNKNQFKVHLKFISYFSSFVFVLFLWIILLQCKWEFIPSKTQHIGVKWKIVKIDEYGMTFYTILSTTGGLINGEMKGKNGNKRRVSVSYIFLIFFIFYLCFIQLVEL